KVLDQLDRGEISSTQAAEQMGVAVGYARTLLTEYRRTGLDPGLLRSQMQQRLDDPRNAQRYAQRKVIAEPVFGQIKENRGFRRFTRRGLDAVNSEWKLICGTHNLLKLWRHHALA